MTVIFQFVGQAILMVVIALALLRCGELLLQRKP